MSHEIAERVIELLERHPSIELLDITGGAPELNPSFRFLVERARALDRSVIDRCNLTILLERGMEGLGEFLAAQGVHIVASLPCYLEANVDAQRGKAVFERSLAALRRLNALGYAMAGSALVLDLVYNPLAGTLPPQQAALEAEYKRVLTERYGISFDHLLTITNVPIARFAHALAREGKLSEYQALLAQHFNASTTASLMCRSLVSVSWDGRLYDCDFNQMCDLPLGSGSGASTVWNVSSFDALTGGAIATDDHCLACTAGHGSSCSGALR
jgi:radical SAM/Cys-rich protein